MGPCCGDRVYLRDRREFATVNRVGVLGVKKGGSFAVSGDSGNNYMYTGTLAQKNVVCCKTRADSAGTTHDLPLDLKTIGSAVLESAGVTNNKRLALYAAFQAATDAEHAELREAFELAGSGSDEARTRELVLAINKRFGPTESHAPLPSA